jgi:hypothetical protein
VRLYENVNSNGGGKLMDGKSRVYDCQQQLVRALRIGGPSIVARMVSEVIRELNTAIGDLGAEYSQDVSASREQLVRALESGDSLRLAREVSEVIGELDAALEAMHFKRAE